MYILQSASKIVFITLTFTACFGFLIEILPVDQFMLLAIAASSFYFSNKGETVARNKEEELPYLGK